MGGNRPDLMQECFLYPRVSDPSQEKKGLSIPYQIRILSEYAEREDLIISGIYTEVETAAKVGRPQFNLMVEELKKPDRPKIVLVDTSDRLTRNDDDAAEIRNLIWRYGVEFHIVRKGAVWDKEMDPDDIFMQDIEIAINKRYITHLRKETLKGIDQKILSGGWSGPAPYGYKNVEDTSKKKIIVVDKQRSTFVVKAFELFATGQESIRSLQERLYQEGFFFSSNKPKISRAQMHSMLVNPAYISEREYKGQIIQCTHEPIVDRSIFEQVQRRLAKRQKTKSSRVFAYNDLMHCGECGGLLSGELKKGGKYTYYRCWRKSDGDCNQGYINEGLIDDAYARLISKMKFPENYREKMLRIMKNTGRRKRFEENEERVRINRELMILVTKRDKAYEDYQEEVLSRDEYLKIKKRYNDQEEILQKALQRIDTANIDYEKVLKVYLELPEVLEKNWFWTSSDKRGAVAKLITSNFSVKDKEPLIELAEPFDKLFEWAKNENKCPSPDVLRKIIALHSKTILRLYQALAA